MKSVENLLFLTSGVDFQYPTTTQGCQNGIYTWWSVWRKVVCGGVRVCNGAAENFFWRPCRDAFEKCDFQVFFSTNEWENCISVSVKNRFGVKMHRIGHEEHEKNVFGSSFVWKKFSFGLMCWWKSWSLRISVGRWWSKKKMLRIV